MARVKRTAASTRQFPPNAEKVGGVYVNAEEAIKRVDSIGKCSFRDAVRLLAPRYGRGVSTESVPREYARGAEEDRDFIAGEIARLTGGVDVRADGERAAARRIRGQASVTRRKIEILSMLHKEGGGQQTWSSSQLGGILVYVFGLEPHKLDEQGELMLTPAGKPIKTDLMNYMNAARYLSHEVVSRMDAVAEVARRGVLRDMHKLLFERGDNEPRVLTTEDVIGALGLYRRFRLDDGTRSGRQKTSRMITVAGGVLESMGLAMKLPRETRGSHTFFGWCHRAHSECRETIPEDSIDYAIAVELLRRGRMRQQALSASFVVHGRTATSDGRFDNASVNKAVTRLEAEGILVVEKEHITNYIRLTPDAEEVMRRQQDFNQQREAAGTEPYLLEDTRRLVLGSYAKTATPRDIRRADRIIRGVRILRRIEQHLRGVGVDVDAFFQEDGGGVAALLREARERKISVAETVRDLSTGQRHPTLPYAHDMVRDGTVPWRNMTKASMTGKYLPLIEEKENVGDVEGAENGDNEKLTSGWIKARVLPELK